MHSSKLSELRQDLLECPSWSSICRYVRMDLCLLCLLFWLNYLFLCVCVYMYIVHVWSGWAASSSEFRVKDRIAFAKIAKPRLLDCLTVGLVSKVFDRSDISLVPTHNIVEGLQADLVACRAIYRAIGVQPQYWSWTEQLTSHWHFFCKKLHRDKPCVRLIRTDTTYQKPRSKLEASSFSFSSISSHPPSLAASNCEKLPSTTFTKLFCQAFLAIWRAALSMLEPAVLQSPERICSCDASLTSQERQRDKVI